MNPIDETNLTAYALGEITDDAERANIEAFLAGNESARREVESIRALAATLTADFSKETLPTGATPASFDPAPSIQRQPRRWPFRVAIAAAATIVVGGVAFSVLAPSLNRAREVAMVKSGSDIRQMGQALNAYSNENRGSGQRISATPNSNATSSLESQSQNRSASQMAAKNPTADAKPVQTGEYKVSDEIDPRGKGYGLKGYGWGKNPSDVTSRDRFIAELQNRLEVTERERRSLAEQMAEVRHLSAVTREGEQPSQLSDGVSVMALTGVIRDEREISGKPYASISIGSADNVRRGMRFEVLNADSTAVLGYLTIDAILPNEATGILSGPRIKEIDRGALVRTQVEPSNTESYARIHDNPFLGVTQNPLSTFSIDVDTASYSNVRRFLAAGRLPPADAVRIEELINYFPYDYAPPAPGDEKPFAAHVEVAECPWEPAHRLVRVGLKGQEIAAEERPASNLVFLLDVSGSMNEPNKLPLVKESLRLLVGELDERDTVTIVVYAGSSGLVLPPTNAMKGDAIIDNLEAGRQRQRPDRGAAIMNAIDKLEAGGSTNGAQGITLAYQQAESAFKKEGVNRVILCTDGDFNVGVTSQGELTRLIEEKAKSGVFLSVLGFGIGNLKDATMEQLADKGNGNYAYIDDVREAKKVLVEQMNSTLVTIAKDVKIQIEFNPAVAQSYRLIGYENRMLAKEDFNDDKKDAGEIGAGHTVTALYEVVPVGAEPPATVPSVDALKYQPVAKAPAAPETKTSGELLTLKLRYKAPDGEASRLMEIPVTDDGKSFARASGDFKFVSAVAGFGMLLRQSPYAGSTTFGGVIEWAGEGAGAAKSGYRSEFVNLVEKARSLRPELSDAGPTSRDIDVKTLTDDEKRAVLEYRRSMQKQNESPPAPSTRPNEVPTR